MGESEAQQTMAQTGNAAADAAALQEGPRAEGGDAVCGEARRPVILIAPRIEEGRIHETEQLSPNECSARCFMDAIFAAGGLPVMAALTDDEQLISNYLDLADGVAIPGGPDVDPKLWGGVTDYDESLLCHVRDAFELPLIRMAWERRLPMLTTCRGTQILNVALGGTLNMDVPCVRRRLGSVAHNHANLLTNTSHEVEISHGSLLERVVGTDDYAVNSAHHCCVERVAEPLSLSAVSDDGVPECVEAADGRFVLGVQWHPEYTWTTSEADFNLWKAFVDACR